MRVVYFSQDYTPHDYRFLEALAGTEHDVHYLRLQDGGLALESRPIPAGVKAIDWRGGRRMFNWSDLPRARRELREVLRQIGPDLVHAGPVQGPAFLTALARFRPLVTMSWGSDLLWKARRGPGRWTATFTLARTDGLVCDSQAVWKRAIELGMAPDRIVMFPWGVDLDHFKPGSKSALRHNLGWQDTFVMLSTRSWEPMLGVDLLVRGFIQAAAERPELRLLMLGTGSLQAQINREIQAAGLLDRVHFAGQVDYDRLPDHYRAADIYVSASHSDGSSVSLLEAMACGLPALVSDIPGNCEWVGPGVNGWWFRDGDADELAIGLANAVRDRARMKQLGLAARSTAEARATWRSNFKELLRAYGMAAPAEKVAA